MGESHANTAAAWSASTAASRFGKGALIFTAAFLYVRDEEDVRWAVGALAGALHSPVGFPRGFGRLRGGIREEWDRDRGYTIYDEN